MPGSSPAAMLRTGTAWLCRGLPAGAAEVRQTHTGTWEAGQTKRAFQSKNVNTEVPYDHVLDVRSCCGGDYWLLACPATGEEVVRGVGGVNWSSNPLTFHSRRETLLGLGTVNRLSQEPQDSWSACRGFQALLRAATTRAVGPRSWAPAISSCLSEPSQACCNTQCQKIMP